MFRKLCGGSLMVSGVVLFVWSVFFTDWTDAWKITGGVCGGILFFVGLVILLWNDKDETSDSSYAGDGMTIVPGDTGDGGGWWPHIFGGGADGGIGDGIGDGGCGGDGGCCGGE